MMYARFMNLLCVFQFLLILHGSTAAMTSQDHESVADEPKCRSSCCLNGRDGRDGKDGISIVGPPGRDGKDGQDGKPGSPGPMGATGLPGRDGINGTIGERGPRGLDGALGPSGPQGLQGLTGEWGASGRNGLDGKDGLPGLRGPSGVKGEKGDRGVQGISGRNGVDGKDGVCDAEQLTWIKTEIQQLKLKNKELSDKIEEIFETDIVDDGCATESVTSYGCYYIRHDRACVDGHNIKLYKQQTVDQCKILCTADTNCKAFEYGVSYGGAGRYKPGDCQLQDSSDKKGCTGSYHNLDLYVKSCRAEKRSNGAVYICSAISGNKDNCYTSSPIALNKWTMVQIRQYSSPSTGKDMFEVSINQQKLYEKENSMGRMFPNVKVYASDPWYPVFHGQLKDLQIYLG